MNSYRCHSRYPKDSRLRCQQDAQHSGSHTYQKKSSFVCFYWQINPYVITLRSTTVSHWTQKVIEDTDPATMRGRG